MDIRTVCCGSVVERPRGPGNWWAGQGLKADQLLWLGNRIGRVTVVAFYVWILVCFRLPGYLGNAEQVLSGKVLTSSEGYPQASRFEL